MLGYLPIGFAFGVLASTAGLSLLSAVAMSLFLYAGSAQLITVGLIASKASVAAITLTVFMVNLRHLLMSASLAPYLSGLSRLEQALFSFEITDESFAVHANYFRKKGVPPKAELFSLNHSAHLSWITGSFLGALLGGYFSLNTEALGIDYALPAMFIALLVMQLENRRQVLIALFAAFLGLTLYLSGLTQLYIIIATVVAAGLGAFLEMRAEKEQASLKRPAKKEGKTALNLKNTERARSEEKGGAKG